MPGPKRPGQGAGAGDRVSRQPGSLHTGVDRCPHARLDHRRLAPVGLLYHKSEEMTMLPEKTSRSGVRGTRWAANEGQLVDRGGHVEI